MRAFRIVQDRHPDARLTLVGGGPQESALRQLADDLRLQHVTFAGRMDPHAVADAYAAHDIYIQSPNIDNMPTSVIEAFATGLPVVSTEAGGIPAILTSGEHGLLAPIDAHVVLAAHVLHLLDDPIDARRMTRAAHASCHQCTWPAVRLQWLRAYRRVLPAPVAPPRPASVTR